MDEERKMAGKASEECQRTLAALLLALLFCFTARAQNAIVVVIDGARLSETFGAGGLYIPHMWNDLKPIGNIYTDFRIAEGGITETVSGHATILTGTWQQVSNDINGVPTKPTVFEYFRQEGGRTQTECYDVVGKSKLAAVAFSSFPGYGSNYGASISAATIEDDQVFSNLVSIMDTHHPKLMLVNFPSVDRAGHSGNWTDYLAAITHADLLVYQLWQKIQSDTFYTPGNTTLFVTNDHGRHDNAHGGFQNHGDGCGGCRSIMLLVVGRGTTGGQVVPDARYQIDIAPTLGELLAFTPLHAEGTSLFHGGPPLPIQLSSFTARLFGAGRVLLEWETATELNNFGFEVQKSHGLHHEYVTIPAGFVPGHGTTLVPQRYSFLDQCAVQSENWYRLKQIDLDGTVHFSDGIRVSTLMAVKEREMPTVFSLSQNFPNPFNPSTTIRFDLPRDSHVSLKLYNVLDQEVAALVEGEQKAGYKSVEWNATTFSSGVYFYRIQAGDFVASKKLLLLK